MSLTGLTAICFIHFANYENTPMQNYSPVLFEDRELTVFYYRSDNLSDEQKERIVDFRNYDDNGKWYVLLDEAQKAIARFKTPAYLFNLVANGSLGSTSRLLSPTRAT